MTQTAKQYEIKHVDLTRVKPYGDTMDDGKMQFSFTLPIQAGLEATEAARRYVAAMGVDDPLVVHSEDLQCGYTFFVVFGGCTHVIDTTGIKVAKVETNVMDMYEVDEYIAKNIGRPVVMLGASTGSDAHTVGIDAIMNMKGYHGHWGLERYKEVDALNMGAQVLNEEFIAKAIELKADALLVSQTVTQKDVHIHNLTNLIELLEAEGIRDKVIVCAGGPRINHELGIELGYDAGFDSHSYAEDVASFVAQEMVKRGWGGDKSQWDK